MGKEKGAQLNEQLQIEIAPEDERKIPNRMELIESCFNSLKEFQSKPWEKRQIEIERIIAQAANSLLREFVRMQNPSLGIEDAFRPLISEIQGTEITKNSLDELTSVESFKGSSVGELLVVNRRWNLWFREGGIVYLAPIESIKLIKIKTQALSEIGVRQ